MMLGYKAHGDSYNALGGTETGWQADYQIRGGTYKAFKLQGDGAGGGRIVTGDHTRLGGSFLEPRGDFYMTGDNYKVRVAGSFQGAGGDFFKGVGVGVKADPGCHSGM